MKIQKFDDFFQASERMSSDACFCYFRIAKQDTTEPVLRSAFIASKKAVDKRAVRRNLAKRKLRAALTSLYPEIQVLMEKYPGMELSVCFVSRRVLLKTDFVTLMSKMQNFLQKIAQKLNKIQRIPPPC